ncbi:SPOR domain-containing protein [Lysobacter niabensis]|uniref:SPOR domain-containing protein n=1 Tax=Agrilutibacter niabensis TaxID=380628 RepID=UPI00361B8040
MEPALKQRVVGAVVLVALAVIFLPMLIKGPAPESGVSDVPLKLPDAPQGDGSMQTRELPLVAPAAAPASGVVGMDASEVPADDATSVEAPATGAGMMPAATAGGDYAVSFGRYATAADADKVVTALRGSQLPGYQETASDNGRTLYRVRIGPYATQADAEAARLRAAHVRDDVGAKVVVLNAEAKPVTTAEAAPPSTSPSQPIATKAAPVSKPEPLVETKPAAPKPVAPAPKPATPTTVATATKPVQPAAAGTGFAVQLGAFASAAEAEKLRDRARAAGLRAFVESVRTDKGVLSRVRVGPVLTRAEADQLKAQVSAKLGIADAIVKPHP